MVIEIQCSLMLSFELIGAREGSLLLPHSALKTPWKLLTGRCCLVHLAEKVTSDIRNPSQRLSATIDCMALIQGII